MTGITVNNRNLCVGLGTSSNSLVSASSGTSICYSIYGEAIPVKPDTPVQTQYYMHRTYKKSNHTWSFIETQSIQIDSNTLFEFLISPNYASGVSSFEIFPQYTYLSANNPIKFTYSRSTNTGKADLYITGQNVDENLDLSGWGLNVTIPGESFYNDWHTLKFDSSHIWLDDVDLNAKVTGEFNGGSFSKLQLFGHATSAGSYVGDFKSMQIVQGQDTLLDATIKPGDNYPDVNTSGYLHVAYPKFGWSEQDFIINGSPYTIMEF